MRRVAIVGPGALGMMLAAALHPVADVCLVGRRPEWAEAVMRRGIVCRGWPVGGAGAGADQAAAPTATAADAAPAAGGAGAGAPSGVPINVRAVTDPKAAGPVDLLILVVKSGQTAGALPAIAELLAGGARAVLSLQNGLAHVSVLAEAIGWDKLIFGTCTYGVTRLDDTVCQLAGEGDIVLGSGPAAAVWPDVADMLRRAGLRVSVAPDTLGAVWQKALINAGINPLTALLGIKNGALLEQPALQAVASAAVREGAAVAAAHGVALAGDPVAAMLDVAARTAANRSSMLQDVTAGRHTEIDAICGEIVRLGDAAGIATPINEALVTLMNIKEEKTRVD